LKSFKSWITCDYFCAIYALIQFVKSSSVLCRVNKNSYFEKKYKFLFVQVIADLQKKRFLLKFIGWISNGTPSKLMLILGSIKANKIRWLGGFVWNSAVWSNTTKSPRKSYRMNLKRNPFLSRSAFTCNTV